jgi:hypothetical protein
VISQAAIEAVTSPENLASFGGNAGMRAVREQDVVAELRRIEDISEGEARRLGRDAVAHVGGWVEPKAKGGLRPRRLTRSVARMLECWWVPSSSVRNE